MAVTEQTPRNVSTAAAGATVFPYSFKIVSKGDLRVEVDGVAKTMDVDFTVSGVGSDAGGNVTFITPLVGGETVARVRSMKYERPTDYQNLGDLRSATLNNDQDGPVLMIQQLAETIGRALHVPLASGGSIDTLLPAPEANRALVWDTPATKLINGELVDPALRNDLASAVSGKGAHLVGFKQSGAGAVARTVESKLRDAVSVKDFGAAGDGVTNDDAAFAAAGAAAKAVYVPKGDYVLTAAPTLGVFWGDGKIFVGGLIQYLHPNPGPVNDIFASVFGPDATGASDASGALQRAINLAQEEDVGLTLEPSAVYKLAAGLTFKHGSNGSDPLRYSVKINGNHAILKPQAGVRAISVVPRCLLADAATGRGESPIHVKDIIIDGGASPATARAIDVGLAGYVTSAFEVMHFTGVTVTGFTGTGVSVFRETKHAQFSRWVQRGGSFEARCSTGNGFCGDFLFEWCEWSGGTVASPALLLDCSAGEVRGIKLVGGAVYGSGAKLNATGTGAIGDIWLTSGVQFDGPAAPANEPALIITADNSSRIFQVHLSDVYFVSYRGPCVQVKGLSVSTIYQIKIDGLGIGPCTISNSVGNSMLDFFSADSISVRNVEFDSVTAAAPGGLMNFDACTNVAVQCNKATRCATVDYMVIIGNGNTHIITDNMANVGVGVVNDYTGGTPTRLVADNLKT